MKSNDEDCCSESAILCAVCNRDITALELRARTTHTERCLDDAVAQQSSQKSYGAKVCLSTLDLLEDCPVCGAAWPALIASRVGHTKRCAKRHGVSDKDLVDLVNMFRESLGSSSSISSPPGRDCQTPSGTSNAGADSRGCRAFIEAFSSPGLAAATLPVQQGSTRGKKRPLAKKASRDRLLPRPIDGWFDRRSLSAEPDSVSDRQSTSSLSNQRLANGSLSMETEDCDDDFQIAKPRSALTQSRIAVRKVSKKRQEFLDDLDDDLNIAKTLSLSLKRELGPVKRGKGVATGKRRENLVARADALAKSDILASREAQNFIRQRAVALERMDEERQAADLLCLNKGKTGVIETESQRSDHSPMRLWDLGALPDASELEYCEIFENYKGCRLGHSSSDACLDDTVDRLMRALSLDERDRFEPSNRPDSSLDENMLRKGYMCLLRAVHGSFARQAATLRCAEWVESSETPVPGECEDVAPQDMSSDSIIILSSESDLDAEPLTAEPLTAEQLIAGPLIARPPAAEPLHMAEKSAWLPVLNTSAAAKKREATSAVVKAPNYAKLAHAELQSLAEKYGLRTNTPRRLLIHQLQTIWEQTHDKRPSTDAASTSADKASERIEDVQLLFSRIRQHIRDNSDLFEQILCYRVLNFDAVYKDVSAAVKCQKSVLRKFFDLEGIVYSSYHD